MQRHFLADHSGYVKSSNQNILPSNHPASSIVTQFDAYRRFSVTRYSSLIHHSSQGGYGRLLPKSAAYTMNG